MQSSFFLKALLGIHGRECPAKKVIASRCGQHRPGVSQCSRWVNQLVFYTGPRPGCHPQVYLEVTLGSHIRSWPGSLCWVEVSGQSYTFLFLRRTTVYLKGCGGRWTVNCERCCFPDLASKAFECTATNKVIALTANVH